MRTTHSAEDTLAAFVDELSPAELPGPRVVRSELAAIFEHGLPDHVAGVPAAQLPVNSRRQKMLTALSGALATLIGKVVLGTAVAAAGVGVAHSAGVVDVPGLPDSTPAVELPAGEVPASDNATDVRQDGDTPAGTEAPDSPGVDGSDVADRATSGEPQEDRQDFGTSIAEDATEGTPAEGSVGGEAGQPAGGADTAADHKPETLPGGSETADENLPDEATGGSDTTDEHVPGDAPATDAPSGRP